ncbi:MAG: VTT domain-containing protein, partial [Candidatus Bilamarchaeaceae archaeon]
IIAGIWLFSDRITTLQELGYLGVFLIALLSNATIFFPAPGWAAVIAMGGVLNPYLVGIAAGVGSAFGELTGYAVGEGAASLANKEFIKQKEMIEKYGSMAIFVLAFIPNPLFDVAGLAAGAIKIGIMKFLIFCMLGRVLRYILLAHLGWLITPYIM